MNNDALLERACRIIESSDHAPPLAELSRMVGLSPFHFQRLFKAKLGVSPKQYALERRRRRLAGALDSCSSVIEAIFEAGFNTSSRVYEGDSALLGMTPRQYKNGGSGQLIKFAIAPCTLGNVLAAITERGICSIQLGDDVEILSDALRARFSAATVEHDEEALKEALEAVVSLVDHGTELSIPLDIQGTAFQMRVWQALQQIPRGQTISYEELARRIDAPHAVRAVANACGSNKIAIAIPCHRVLRKNGDLGGYRWGLEKKRALLKREEQQ